MNNSTTLPEQPKAPQYIVVTATIFYIMIFLVGVVGNVLVVVIIRFSRTLKTSVNLYLLNLCVADLLVLIVCMPTALADIYTKEAWYFGAAMCKLVPFIENSVANASVLTIIAIGVERYRVVSNPLSVIDETSGKIWKIVLAIWIVSVVTSAPCCSIAVYRNSTLVDMTPIMVCRNTIDLPWKKVYLVLLNVMFFLVPSCILFGLYGHLCRLLMRTNQFCQHGPISGRVNYNDRKRIQRQVLNIIGSIVVIFFVCHLPLRVTGLYLILERSDRITRLGLESYLNLLFSTRIMFYLNHALNPIVYNFVSTKFRSALKSLCCSKRQANSGTISSDRRRKQSFNFTNSKKMLQLSKNKRTEAVELERINRDTTQGSRSLSRTSDSPKKTIFVNKTNHVACHVSSSASSSNASKGSTGERSRDQHSVRPNRQKMNDFYNDYCECQTNKACDDRGSSTTSSSKDYDLKIKVNQKAVCITLNMKKATEKGETVEHGKEV